MLLNYYVPFTHRPGLTKFNIKKVRRKYVMENKIKCAKYFISCPINSFTKILQCKQEKIYIKKDRKHNRCINLF